MWIIIESIQKEHISERGRERPRHSTSTSDVQDLCHALADMFGLPLLPIPQPAPDQSPSPMAAISQSQSQCDESRQSPAKSTVPLTREHSPEPEEPRKQQNVGDLKDPAHPLHRHGAQKAYEHWLDKAQEEANDSPKRPLLTTSLQSPNLESIPEEDMPPEENPPIAGPSTIPGEFSEI